ncbi:MAG: hypothetical protein HYS74_00550 [Parcubacteria group bacterium]|nr:hypothetical protein [Parcubacteria group bacterium]
MGNCVEESDRNRLIEEILDARHPGQDHEDLFARRDLRRELARMTREELECRLGRTEQGAEQ